MSESMKQILPRLHALEDITVKATTSVTGTIDAATSTSFPAQKKRKTEAFSSAPVVLTDQVLQSPVLTSSIPNTSENVSKIESSIIKRVALKRTLPYTPSVSPASAEDYYLVLQRICSGQMSCDRLPIAGRVKEHRIIREMLKGGEIQTGSLFIIGPPGTGKSSSVTELLLEQGFIMAGNDVTTLKRNRVEKSIKTAVKLNCSMFTDPVALYAIVAQQVKKATSWKVPEEFDPFDMDKFIALQQCAVPSTMEMIAVVLDEVDQLLRLPVRIQPVVKDVLHFFVRWAATAAHNVKFLGIMNGVDMYQQVSRIHVTRESALDTHIPRVVFGSYLHPDLLLIMQSYVLNALSSTKDIAEVAKLIEPRAIELIARKVAARNGDARLAISLLQQSARHTLQRIGSFETVSASSTQVKVTMRDVFQCVTSILSSPVIQQIEQLPRQAKVLLYVITTLAPGCNENGSNNRSKGTVRHCDMNMVSEKLAHLRGLPQTAWVPRLSREELQTHLMSLDCYGLVRQGRSKRGEKTWRPATIMSAHTFWSIKLNSCVTMGEISGALQDDTTLSKLLL